MLLLMHLQKDMDIVQFDIVVRRSHVLVDAINRTKNDPTKHYNVSVFMKAILADMPTLTHYA